MMTKIKEFEPEKASFLTVIEVAQIFRVCSMTILRGIKAGDIPAYRFGKKYLIPKKSLGLMLKIPTNLEH